MSRLSPLCVLRCAFLVALLAAAPAMAQDDDLDFMFEDEQETEAQATSDSEAAESEPADETAQPESDASAGPDGETLETIPVGSEDTSPPLKRGRVIEEIVVTAQKREQAMQDVPISMSAITGEMLVEQGVTDVREALLLVPNASVDQAGFFAAPRVRGFTLNNNNKSFEPPVGMVLDGIPHTRIEYFMAALFDVQRMEVLRGPQGTSFGKNTTAGLIHVIGKPPTADPNGSLTIETGELDRRRIEGAYGGALMEGVNFRIAGLVDDRDGFIRNTTAEVVAGAPEALKDRRRDGLRATIEAPDLWGSKLQLAHERFSLFDGGAALEILTSGPVFQDTLLRYDPGHDFTGGNWVHSQDFPDFRDVDIQRTRVQLDRNIGEWGLVVLGAVSNMEQTLSLDTDFTAAPAILGTGSDRSPEEYGEIRVVAPTFGGLFGLNFLPGNTDFLVGVSGGRRRILDSHFTFGINNTPFWDLVQAAGTDSGDTGSDQGGSLIGVPVDPATTPTKLDEFDQQFAQDIKEFSVFGHMQWQFLPAWGLELGGRYTTEKKNAFWNVIFTTPPPNPTLEAVGAEEFTTTRELDLKNFQPKISLNWKQWDALSVFLHWEKGFKAGGFNAFAFREGNDPVRDAGFEDDDLVFRDEVATNWGLDFKSKLFGGAANLNVSLFRQVATDFQVLIRENPPGTVGLGTSRVINADEAMAQGVEADLLWLATDWLTVAGSLGVLDTEFIRFPDGECPVGHGNTDGDDNPRCDQSGKEFPFAPKLGTTLSLRLNVPMSSLPWIGSIFGASGVNFAAGVLGEYESSQLLDIDLDERKRQDAYTRYKADLGLRHPANGWTVRLVGENLTDTVTWIRYGDIFTDVIVGSQNQPRLFYLQFRQEF